MVKDTLIPLTKKDMDEDCRAGCENPDCKRYHKPGSTIIYANTCHIKNGLKAKYQYDSGILVLMCTKCDAVITAVKVADEEKSELDLGEC